MRASKLFAPTLREAPAEAEAASHVLLLRAAFVRKVAAGIYTNLPFGVRSMRKIEDIIREEMDASGAQEIRMPIVLPAEPWKVTGRWQAYGDLMFKLTDRHGREMGLGPTEEEVVTPMVAAELPSYRDLPVNLYQIEWKYRDEFRPRYGLLRGREFLMKDAYSFDRDEDGMRASYDVMYEAYKRIFDRCGLEYRIVEADPGQIGGGVNHEYLAVTEAGEDTFLYCGSCDYAADLEAATPGWGAPGSPPPAEPLTEIHTPDAATIQAVADLVGRPASEMLKTMLFDAGGQTVAVLLPGDHEVNEEKVARLFFPTLVRAFDEKDFGERGFAKGYVGPQGMPGDAVVIADPSVRLGANWVTGANRTDHHVTGANEGRDFRVDRWEDVVQAVEGDPCPVDGGSAPCRPRHRRRSHLPVGDAVLRAAEGDVPGRGRHRAAVPDGLLRDRHLADHGGRRRAVPRRRRADAAAAGRPVRGRRDRDEHGPAGRGGDRGGAVHGARAGRASRRSSTTGR